MYWIGLVYSQDNQHPEFPVDPETNVCDIFNEDGQTRNMCLKSEFPEETIDTKYDSVSQCCNGHGFVFTDECNDRPDLRKKEVCGFPSGEEPKPFKEDNVCPKDCRDNILLLDGDFTVDANGNLQITKFGDFQQKIEVKHYCASYKCDDFDQDWVATVKACVCVKNDTLAQMSDDLDPLLRKCSNLDTLHENLSNVENTYSEFQSLNRTHVQANEPFTDPIFKKKDDESYCIGPKWQTPTNYKELVKMNLFVCKNLLVCKQDTSEGGNSESSGMSEQLPVWAILLIVLAVVAGALLIGFIAWKKKYRPISTNENIELS
jgi:hypothetical protein